MTFKRPYQRGIGGPRSRPRSLRPRPMPEPTVNKGDNAWMLTSTVLVLLMTIPGLALFYGGLVRSKNMLSVLAQVFYTVCIVTHPVGAVRLQPRLHRRLRPFIGGFSKAFLMGVDAELQGGDLHRRRQHLGAGLCLLPDDLRGDHARPDRRRLRRTHEVLGGGAVHPALGDPDLFPDRAHGLVLGRTGRDLGCGQGARRGGDAAAKAAAQAKLDEVNADAGWVFQKGAIDFAGGTVVHINAGIAGLVGALLIGKRIGYGKELMAPHSLTMTMIGASLLWVGWFGFNAGSNLEANGGAALAMTNSFVATAAAALSWMFAEWIVKGHPSLLGALSGAVAGLVAVTPAAGYAGPMGAIVLGLVVGVVCLFFCTVMKNALGYDDSLDVFGVHCIGGIVGALGTGILVNPALGGTGIMDYTTGKIADYDFAAQMISQGKARLHHAGVVGRRLGDPLQGRRRRSSACAPPSRSEREGLDITEHTERAYNM